MALWKVLAVLISIINKKEYYNKYYRANRERILALKKQYRLLNKKKISKKRKEYYLLNKEKEINNSREYYKTNKEIQNSSSKKWKDNHKEDVKKYRKGYYLNNKEKENNERKKWRASNKRKVKNMSLKQVYGIKIEQFDELIKNQENKCGVCKTIFTEINPYIPSIDHVHDETKRIRGLLCIKCNSALGLLGDNIENLKKAINWIKGIQDISLKNKTYNYIVSKKYLSHIKRVYGVSKEYYNSLISKNKNKCGICGNTFTYKYPNKPCIDHNHETKKIRGLLCFKCNTAIGFFNDNSKVITMGINWIKGGNL